MGKTTYVLLIALITLILTLAGVNQEMAISNRDITDSLSCVELPSQGNTQEIINFNHGVSRIPKLCYVSWDSSESEIVNSLDHPLSNALITSFFLGHRQPYCLRSSENDGQSLTLNRVSPGNRNGKAISYKIPKTNSQSKLQKPASFSSNLLESSPPGYFPLI